MRKEKLKKHLIKCILFIQPSRREQRKFKKQGTVLEFLVKSFEKRNTDEHACNTSVFSVCLGLLFKAFIEQITLFFIYGGGH